MKKIISITLALGFVSTLFAEPNIPLDKSEVKARDGEGSGCNQPF